MAVTEIDRLIELLARLPGLGPRSARRAVLHLIKKREALLSTGGAEGVELPLPPSAELGPQQIVSLDDQVARTLDRFEPSTRSADKKVQLGRAHIGCGRPVVYGPDSDIYKVADDIMAQLQYP